MERRWPLLGILLQNTLILYQKMGREKDLLLLLLLLLGRPPNQEFLIIAQGREKFWDFFEVLQKFPSSL